MSPGGRCLFAIVVFMPSALLVVGCIFFSDFDGLTGGAPNAVETGGDARGVDAPGGDARGADAHADSPTCGTLGIDSCKVISAFTGVQVVDGFNSDFCTIPTTTYVAAAGKFPNTSPVPGWVNSKVFAQVGWSSDAFHVFVYVEQMTVNPNPDIDALFKGDAIEIFVSSTDQLTGLIGHDHTAHVTIAPPSSSLPARASSDQIDLTNAPVAGRLVSDGYTVELLLPWSLLMGPASVDGGAIGFDLGVDVAESSADGGPVFQSFLWYPTSAVAPVSGCTSPQKPSCDDLTWCTPNLSN